MGLYFKRGHFSAAITASATAPSAHACASVWDLAVDATRHRPTLRIRAIALLNKDYLKDRTIH